MKRITLLGREEVNPFEQSAKRQAGSTAVIVGQIFFHHHLWTGFPTSATSPRARAVRVRRLQCERHPEWVRYRGGDQRGCNTNGIPDECEGEGMMGPSTGSGTGGESMTMAGEGGETPPQPSPSQGEGDAAAWEAFYDWAATQCWGPSCETTGAEQFAAMAAKLKELGLPVARRVIGTSY